MTNKALPAPTHTPRYSHTYYLEHLIRTKNLQETITRAIAVLRKHDFDALAFRGASGMLLGVPLAVALDKTMIMVRKDTQGTCHSSYPVEGDAAAKRYVIVDDLIRTGATVRAILAAVQVFAPQAECIGAILSDNLWGGGESSITATNNGLAEIPDEWTAAVTPIDPWYGAPSNPPTPVFRLPVVKPIAIGTITMDECTEINKKYTERLKGVWVTGTWDPWDPTPKTKSPGRECNL